MRASKNAEGGQLTLIMRQFARFDHHDYDDCDYDHNADKAVCLVDEGGQLTLIMRLFGRFDYK